MTDCLKATGGSQGFPGCRRGITVSGGGQGRGMSGQGRPPFVPPAIRAECFEGTDGFADRLAVTLSARTLPGLCFSPKFLVAGGTTLTVGFVVISVFCMFHVSAVVFLLCVLLYVQHLLSNDSFASSSSSNEILHSIFIHSSS